MRLLILGCGIGTATLAVAAGVSAAALPAPPPSFERTVAPIFGKYCMPCHDSATRTRQLDLESYAGLMKGGAHGPVIVPGKSGESLLVLLIEGKRLPKMPPGGPAPTPEEITRLRAWIDAGAHPDARDEGRTSLPAPPRRGEGSPTGTETAIAGSPEPRPVVPVAGQLASVAFSPDGRQLAAGGYREVLLLDAITGKVTARLSGPAGVVNAVAFSPDGRLLAAAGGAPGQFGEILIWDGATGRGGDGARKAGPPSSSHRPVARPTSLRSVCAPPRVLHGHRDAIYSVAFSPDGRTLAAASYDRLVSLWSIGGGQPRMLKEHTDAVYAVAFSPDGRRIASASGDRTVKIWDVATGKRVFTLSDATAELYAVAFHPSGRQLAAAGVDKRIRTWKLGLNGGTLLRSTFAHDGAIVRLLYSPDGRRLVTAGEDRAIKVWNAVALTEQKVYEQQPDWPTALALSPDGRRLAAGRYDGSLALYDAETGRRLAALAPRKAFTAEAQRTQSKDERRRQPLPRTSPTSASPAPRANRGVRTAPVETDGKPTVVPAALRSISPPGVARGGTATFTLKGVNISGATRVYFDDPAITGKVVRPPIPLLKRSEVKVEAAVGPQARLGIHKLFLQTPMGTTGAVPFAVGGWPEIAEKEPNDALERATSLPLPATAVGKLATPGDVDSFRFEVRAGQELVFQVVAQPIGSGLNSVLTLLDARGNVLARNDDAGGSVDSLLGYRFAEPGSYVIQIRDYQDAAGDDVYYRLNAGELPYVTGVFPLGVQRGHGGEITARGFNLSPSTASAGMESARIRMRGPAARPAAAPWGETTAVTIRTPHGSPLNEVRVAVGEEPELREAEPDTPSGPGSNDTPATAQRVAVPVTINGRIGRGSDGGTPDVDCYLFRARKGERLILEVAASRLGSPLDSFLEVLDARGRPLERATLRCVAETALTLSDRDANSQGFRIQSWADLAVNDLVFAGRELLRIRRLPNGPDDDVVFESLRGRRAGLLDTTPEFHSVGAPVYKVTVHPPGRSFPPNGMPVFHLMVQNDDGGPLYGSDSRVTFDPPADGDYIVRLTDVEGRGGAEYTYRLTLRAPRPDFRLAMNPEYPNVPQGGSVPIEVTAERLDGYGGPITVRLEGLPPGFSAAAGLIPARAMSTTLTLSAAPDAVTPARSILRVTGRARIGAHEIVRTVVPEGGIHLAVLPHPDVSVATDVRRVEIRPGGQVQLTAIVERHNGFGGRVPIEVLNLPFGVRVLDVGLNGVLVTEKEASRRFVLVAEPWVKPCVQPFYAVARVESDPASELASPPILLTVTPLRATGETPGVQASGRSGVQGK